MVESIINYFYIFILAFFLVFISACSNEVSSVIDETIVLDEALEEYQISYEVESQVSYEVELETNYQLVTYAVEDGDTLERIFRRLGISANLAYQLSNEFVSVTNFQILMPGEELNFYYSDGDVVGLKRILSLSTDVTFWFNEDSIEFDLVEADIEVKIKGGRYDISNSLFLSGIENGLTDGIIMNLANIFQWQIDFIYDIRPNDQYSLIYEVYLKDGAEVGVGSIIAAQFINNGKSYSAFRFQDSDRPVGYYDEFGQSLRRAFLRAPLEFSRVSSNFNLNRRHPILNTIRAHRGIDYAAPTGTPVMAAGGGKIIFRGIDRGYGNTVVIQHGGNVTTLYAHLDRFSNFQVGAAVNQMDIIGYVGKSGLATGAHLHYEYRINDIHQNPAIIELPETEAITVINKESFNSQALTYLEKLQQLDERGIFLND
jgi:murein DD-endopeptidase MepM/ murein hydrolase activator NlpD